MQLDDTESDDVELRVNHNNNDDTDIILTRKLSVKQKKWERMTYNKCCNGRLGANIWYLFTNINS